MANTANVTVHIRETKGDINRLIKKFNKKVKKERILEEYRERMFYEKPSKKRRREKIRKVENARKAQKERDDKLVIK
jgi:small subunit ribosomal protein S21